MSVDLLHEKIRKLKNPSMVDLSCREEMLPPHLLAEHGCFTAAYGRFCRELMDGLQEIVPVLRFPFGDFALLGADGLKLLSELLTEAGEKGFYRVLECPGIYSPLNAENAAKTLLGGETFRCDALIIDPYIGTDGIKPFLPYCKNDGKALFVVVRSPNKSALELQDLMTGSRLVHGAAAELAVRHGETILGKCAYSQVGALVSAGVPQSLKNLRTKHDRLFLLVDGLDYPSGNAKNCSNAFDRFGHGAVVCAGESVTAAWKESDSDGRDYVSHAVQSAERMKKNICRYITVL